jgi:hypothetical protein
VIERDLNGAGRSGYASITLGMIEGLSDEVCVVWVTDSALVAGKDTDDHEDHQDRW